jgi:hypothetical protein
MSPWGQFVYHIFSGNWCVDSLQNKKKRKKRKTKKSKEKEKEKKEKRTTKEKKRKNYAWSNQDAG